MITSCGSKQKEPSRVCSEPPIFRLTAEHANRLCHGDYHGDVCTIFIKFHFVDEIVTCVGFLLHYCIVLERRESGKPGNGQKLSWPMRQHIAGVIVPVQQREITVKTFVNRRHLTTFGLLV